ncbi:MAG TPA: MbnP family copper-binding protein [Steroidobacteraceae bacterium]|nr:MbnP family copper-binding protein [Steroidobacteraceae bacterium]
MAHILLPVLALSTGLLSSCGSGATRVAIRFGIDGDAAAVRSLQFYVHAIELLDEHGKPHPFRLAAAQPWQSEHVVLLDLAGDPSTPRHASVAGEVAGESGAAYSGIRLTIGVPFELNHDNPLTAAAPLDRSEMFWNWQSGHKFLRADLAVEDHEWSFHVGSTGCSSASALRPPAQPCAHPNEMRLELKGDPLRGVVRVRLDSLIAAARAANYVVCTGDYQVAPACKDAYAATGLQPGTPQSLWVLQ